MLCLDPDWLAVTSIDRDFDIIWVYHDPASALPTNPIATTGGGSFNGNLSKRLASDGRFTQDIRDRGPIG